jgi:hypothetical protein
MAAGMLSAAPVSALAVTYEWKHSSQTRTAGLPATIATGTLTFSHASITDPANFSGIPMGALTALTFNSLAVSVSLADIVDQTFESPSTAFSAAGGFLTTDFLFTKLVASPVFNLNLNSEIYNPGGATSTAFLQIATPQGTRFESGVGDWQLAWVPLPAAWLLMLAGLLGLGWLSRRR